MKKIFVSCFVSPPDSAISPHALRHLSWKESAAGSANSVFFLPREIPNEKQHEHDNRNDGEHGKLGVVPNRPKNDMQGQSDAPAKEYPDKIRNRRQRKRYVHGKLSLANLISKIKQVKIRDLGDIEIPKDDRALPFL